MYSNSVFHATVHNKKTRLSFEITSDGQFTLLGYKLRIANADSLLVEDAEDHELQQVRTNIAPTISIS